MAMEWIQSAVKNISRLGSPRGGHLFIIYDKHVIYDVSQPAGLEEKHGSRSHKANSRNLEGYGLESMGNWLDLVLERRKYK